MERGVWLKMSIERTIGVDELICLKNDVIKHELISKNFQQDTVKSLRPNLKWELRQ